MPGPARTWKTFGKLWPRPLTRKSTCFANSSARSWILRSPIPISGPPSIPASPRRYYDGPPTKQTGWSGPWTIATLISLRRGMGICGSVPRPSWRLWPSSRCRNLTPSCRRWRCSTNSTPPIAAWYPPTPPLTLSPSNGGPMCLPQTRRYANPDTYLIPPPKWPALRPEVCQQLHVPEDGAVRLEQRGRELVELLPRVDRMLSHQGPVRMEKGRVVVSPLEAEERSPRVEHLEETLTARLPLVDLPDLLIEVDQWTGFSHHLRHLNGREPRQPDFLPVLYAALLAQGCNFGFARMAQMAEIPVDRLAWCTTWYLREDTLKAATDALVNFHHRLPLSQRWGGGTLSSSDGQRIPVAGKIRNATALRRYFLSQGLTFYSWTSDQFAQYGTKVVPATIRDATYVLDAILDNTTELSLVEHTTDTAGYTEMVFALFDLLGMQFAPRLRDIGDQQLYRMSREQKARHLAPRLKGIIKQDFILRHWDDFLRLAGSLKLGWVTASLFISKLQAYPRQNILAYALQEYGRLVKTLFILRYLESQDYRRRINAQLKKGESLHALRDFLFVADKGVIRRKQEEAQTNQAMCLNLITNAVVVWNTVYMQAVLDRLGTEGLPVDEDDLAHLSPARFEHVNPYGKYLFPLEQAPQRHGLRPL